MPPHCEFFEFDSLDDAVRSSFPEKQCRLLAVVFLKGVEVGGLS